MNTELGEGDKLTKQIENPRQSKLFIKTRQN